MIIDRIHSSLVPKRWQDDFRVSSIICHILSGFPDTLLADVDAIFSETRH